MSDILLVEEINDVEKFRSLREIWNTLLQKSSDNNIFLTWEWLFTWWQHHSVGKKLRILLIKDMNRIIAIVPLMQSKERKGIFQLDFIENICAQNCDYSGIILTEKKHECLTCLLEHLVNMLKDNNMIVRMWHIPENSSFLGILRQQYPSFTDSIHMTERPISSCPYIKLPATWEEYYRALHHGTQKSLRKKINKLQKNHVVGFRKYTGSPDLRAQLQTLFRLHQKRWQNKGITSKFTRANEQDFYFDVSEYFYQNGWLNMSFLTVDGSPVSATWGFDYKNEYYSMTSAFNLDYSTYSVGAIHLMELI
jgi:CelD/BcsL family acetyltransferase involved in cellulose biosynthesis